MANKACQHTVRANLGNSLYNNHSHKKLKDKLYEGSIFNLISELFSDFSGTTSRFIFIFFFISHIKRKYEVGLHKVGISETIREVVKDALISGGFRVRSETQFFTGEQGFYIFVWDD